MFHDCLPSNWQVQLWIEGKAHYFSARAAANVLYPEESFRTQGKRELYLKARRLRQGT